MRTDTMLQILGIVATVVSTAMLHAASPGFESAWPRNERTWVGPEYWANRLQDWRVADGRLECLTGYANKPMRTVHLLTHRLGGHGDLAMSVRTGVIDPSNRFEGTAHSVATGFLIAAGGATMDYRAAALIHHNPGPGGGYLAGIDGSGRVFIRDFETALTFGGPASPGARLPADRRTPISRGLLDDVTLRLTIEDNGATCDVAVTATSTATGRPLGTVRRTLEAGRLVGNIALVSHPGGRQRTERYWFRDWGAERRRFEKWAGATARFWFRDWRISGARLDVDHTRALGPVLSTQYTVHRGTLKLTAQLFPVSSPSARTVRLEIRDGARWRKAATAGIAVPGYTASFRVAHWDTTRVVPYRVVCEDGEDGGARAWTGTIRREASDKRVITVAAFTGNMMVRGGYEYPLPYGVDVPFPPELEDQPVTRGNVYPWNRYVYFPHAEVVRHVAQHEPDLLFFSGDQVYEGNPTRAVERPFEEAHLDYLYKWYLWCWTWRELTRDIPAVTIPDDHDVYQRNIWGAGGEGVAPGDLDGSYGGYFMPARWINMIQRTQTSHLPPPYDPRTAKNGIQVYYTALTVGGIGFAIIEDRKFKSFPTVIDAAMSRDSHITEFPYDTRKADVPGATLLGERQLAFLRAFAADWRGQEMKAVLSQTIFANLQILNPRKDGVPQKFDIPLDRDLDSNGWPQTGRRRALEEMRRGFMVHIAGDQHLASVIHHGIDDWEDACWSLCVPSVANYYARSWNPAYPPVDHRPGMARYTGRYEDGFHNKLTVAAVANPDRDPPPGKYPEPVELHAEMPGYGVVRFDKLERTITLECWPRYVDPADPSTGSMYPGWPVRVRQLDNYARRPTAWLPEIAVTGAAKPVVQVIDESNDELVYSLRLPGPRFRPPVFQPGRYTLRVGTPERDLWKTFPHLAAGAASGRVLEARLTE